MTIHKLATKVIGLTILVGLIVPPGLAGQGGARQTPVPAKEGGSQAQMSPPTTAAPGNDNQIFEDLYLNFYHTYRLGADDEVAIHVLGQPDFSMEKVKISPVGRIYYPTLGDLKVAGLTVDQLTKKLAAGLSEYLINPKVTVSLLEARSAKVGVLGEVVRPGIVVIAAPTTVLDAIEASGGFTDFGSKSDVTLFRAGPDGRLRQIKVNVKRILEGNQKGEEDLPLQAGDTLIVNGNTKKKLSTIVSLAGFSSFVTFLSLGRR
jgi:polysaccharide export outer membrane protein